MRRIIGLSGPFGDRHFSPLTVTRNVSLLTPESLHTWNEVVVKEGGLLAG